YAEAQQDGKQQCATRSTWQIAEVEERDASGFAACMECNAHNKQHCDAGPQGQHPDCRTQSRFHAFLQPNSADSFQLSFSVNFKSPGPDRLPVLGLNPKSAPGGHRAVTSRCSGARSPVDGPECFPIPLNTFR